MGPGPISGAHSPPPLAGTLLLAVFEGCMGLACRIVVDAITIDEGKCSACGLCYEYCPTSALADRGDGVPKPFVDKCIACLGCMALCGEGAIDVVLRSVCAE